MRCLTTIYNRHIELLLSRERVVFGEFLVDASGEIAAGAGITNAAIERIITAQTVRAVRSDTSRLSYGAGGFGATHSRTGAG